MTLAIVSDLHIHGAEDPLYSSLLKLLNERQAGDTLVLAGDIFDLFVGNKGIFRRRYAAFLDAAQRAGERGVELHYIEGNHDFQLRDVFKNFRNIEVHPFQASLQIAGKRFLVLHGDLADQKDYRYKLLRRFFRSIPMRAFIRHAPDSWIKAIGERSSHYSRGKNPRLPANLPTDRIERLRSTYRSFAATRLAEGFDHVVMGHCHDLDEMSFTIGGRKGQYINMGFPPVHGSYLSWSPGDEEVHRQKLP